MVIMRGLALDTNVAIDILNGKKDIAEECFLYYPIYLPIIVCGELIFGAINSNQISSNLNKYTDFIDDCHILNTTSNVSLEYAKIRKQLKEKGNPIPENDIWIAALCKSFEIPLATKDNHFKLIEDLELKNIYRN
jgi:tRNA(fMet)-specific endonuclease VapC